jgi:hypothetical protein
MDKATLYHGTMKTIGVGMPALSWPISKAVETRAIRLSQGKGLHNALCVRAAFRGIWRFASIRVTVINVPNSFKTRTETTKDSMPPIANATNVDCCVLRVCRRISWGVKSPEFSHRDENWVYQYSGPYLMLPLRGRITLF